MDFTSSHMLTDCAVVGVERDKAGHFDRDCTVDPGLSQFTSRSWQPFELATADIVVADAAVNTTSLPTVITILHACFTRLKGDDS